MNQTTDTKIIFAPEDYQNHWNENIPDEIYHADKTAVNSSSLRKMPKSPFAFYSSFFLGKNEEPSESMKFGTLAHMALLQGSKFKEKYVVIPEFVGPTLKGEMSTQSKAAKEMKAAWLKDQPPDTVFCTEKDKEKIIGMIESVLSHGKAAELLKNGKPEIAGYWRDKETGIRCRMKADFISFDLGVLLDVKTTTDSSWLEFRRSVEKHRYDIQMMMYDDGVKNIVGKKSVHRIWMAIESKPPYEVRLHEVIPEYEATGLYEYRASLRKIKDCVEKNNFPQGQLDIEFGRMSTPFFNHYNDIGAFNDITAN